MKQRPTEVGSPLHDSSHSVTPVRCVPEVRGLDSMPKTDVLQELLLDDLGDVRRRIGSNSGPDVTPELF